MMKKCNKIVIFIQNHIVFLNLFIYTENSDFNDFIKGVYHIYEVGIIKYIGGIF